MVTDYIKELKALYDVVVMVDGPQGVGKEGEARAEIEKLCVESTSNKKEEVSYYNPPEEVIQENVKDKIDDKKDSKKDVEVYEESDEEGDDEETVDDFDNRFNA